MYQKIPAIFLIINGISFATENYVVENYISGKDYWITYNVLDENGNYIKKGLSLTNNSELLTTNNLTNLTTDLEKIMASKVLDIVSNNVTRGKYAKITTATQGEHGAFQINIGDTSLFFKAIDESGNTITKTKVTIGTGLTAVNFIGNGTISTSSNILGGAINNEYTRGEILGDFIGNYANGTHGAGGAISNKGTLGDITGNFIGNYSLGTSSSATSGAIYSTGRGIIGNITGDFIGNYSSSTSGNSSGGAIGTSLVSNSGGTSPHPVTNTIKSITGDFIGNYTQAHKEAKGGAIYGTTSQSGNYYKNTHNIIGNIEGDFIGNYAISASSTSQGGAIYNYAYTPNTSANALITKTEIGDITGSFIGNYVEGLSTVEGGAIYNSIFNNKPGEAQAIIGNILGNFIGNSATSLATSTSRNAYGGAIYNRGKIGNIEGDFIKNSVRAPGEAQGGAIYAGGSLGDIEGNFIGNSATSSSSEAYGGAIYNFRIETQNIKGNFIENNVTGLEQAYGGAIYNGNNNPTDLSIIGNIEGNFIRNSATSTSRANGGAIYNTGEGIESISGSFIGNSAISSSEAYGGAIYNGSKLSLIAKGQNIEFTDNYISNDGGITKISNALHSAQGETNLLSEENYSITFNDRITGTGTINVDGEGTVVLNEDMSGYTGDVNFNDGTIKIGSKMTNEAGDTNFFGGNFNLLGTNLKLDSINGKIDKFDVSNWTGTSTLNVGIEIDMRNKDNLLADSFENINGQSINITDIEIILESEAPTLKEAVVLVGEGDDLSKLSTEVTVISGIAPIYQYEFQSKLNEDGTLVINTVESPLDPEVELPEPPVEDDLETETPKPQPPTSGSPTTDYNPQVLKGTIGIGAYVANFTSITDRILNKKREYNFDNSIWIDTYGSDEKIYYDTKFGKKDFDNKVMITTAGFDYIYDRVQGMEEMSSIYFGHLKSDQEYENISTEQEGFYLGTAFELIKDNNYLNFTLLAGKGKVNDKKTKEDKFDLYSFSTALKLGKEYKVDEKISIDSSLILGYHNVMSDGYINSRGVTISSETTNVLNISPELKITRDIKGYKPYIALAYNYNTYSGGELKAKHEETLAILPRVEVRNYSELRIGMTKEFKNNTLKTYGEIVGRKGDKDSFGGQLGLEYKF